MPDDRGSASLLDQAREKLKQNDRAAAIDLLVKLCGQEPLNHAAHEMLATACFLAGRLQEAAEHYKEVVRLQPRRMQAFNNLGAVYNRLGEHQQAIQILRRGLTVDRKSAEAYFNLGYAHHKLNQHALAIPAFREAVRINPDFAEAHQLLGQTLLEMGNTQQAIAEFQRVVELRPDSPRARKALEEATSARNANRTSSNPFGRLVSEPGATTGARRYRTLTDEERYQDRHKLSGQLLEIERTARGLLEHLVERLEPGLRTMGRELAGRGVALIMDEIEPLAAAFRALAGELKAHVEQLRQHEAQYVVE